MAEPQTLASPNVVGRRLGVTVPTPAQLERITDAIIDAQDAVEGYLNRSLFPTTVVQVDQSPRAGHPLTSYAAWDYEQYDDDVAVASATETGPDAYTVTLTIGLDGPNTRPIVRYVVWHAAESLRLDPSSGMGKLAVKSVSAEGQSVSYEAAQARDGNAGAAPKLDDLRAFRRYSAFKRDQPVRAPWPHGDVPVGWDPR